MKGTSPSRTSRDVLRQTVLKDQMGGAKFPSTVHSEGEVMTIIAIGIDLAKNVFAVHGVDLRARPF
jgi:hypothetical protein